MSKRISRGAFLLGLAAAGVAASFGRVCLDPKEQWRRIPCRRLGPSRNLGHMLRDGAWDRSAMKAGSSPRRKQVLIVGGGIAGLSAGWWLKKNGFDDFVILELEKDVGGNSASSKNSISAFPWGAHYVPIANDESEYVRTLFEELGIIQSYDAQGKPVYNELYLCHDPQERLYKDGQFQEGLVPNRGLQQEDRAEMSSFFEIAHGLKKKKGKDAKAAFAIPLDLSSQDPDLLALDKISMAEWLKQNNFISRPLLWYLNYCCRDDYGSSIENVSAWAALHYFAGRTGTAANAENNAVLTWPEGNGFLVSKLKEKLSQQIIASAVVSRVAESGSGELLVSYFDPQSKGSGIFNCDKLIFAAPRFLAKYLIANNENYDRSSHHELSYAPWMVANISLKKPPESKGMAIAWDNVNYYSNSLGYVVATHQNISTRAGATVITYYFPLSQEAPGASRKRLQSSSDNEWVNTIVADLEKMHPGISNDILGIELWPWGHGMIRPSVGFIWGENRRRMKDSNGRIYFAHSDMSGMSNFEEAQYHGVEAARAILAALSSGPNKLRAGAAES